MLLNLQQEPPIPEKEKIIANDNFQNKFIKGLIAKNLQEKEIGLVELAKKRGSFVEVKFGEPICYPEKDIQVQVLNFDSDRASHPIGFVISPTKNQDELRNFETFKANKKFKILSFNAFNIGGPLIDKKEIWQKINEQNPEVICINGVNLEEPQEQPEIKKLTDLGYTIYFNYMSNGIFGNLIAIKNPGDVKLKLRIPTEGFSYSNYPTQQVLEDMIKDKSLLIYTQLIVELENNFAIGTNYINPFSDSSQRLENVKQIADYSQDEKVFFHGPSNFSNAIYCKPYKGNLVNNASSYKEIVRFLGQEYPSLKYFPDNSRFRLNPILHIQSPSIEELIENLEERLALKYLGLNLSGALTNCNSTQIESNNLPNFQHLIQLFEVYQT